MNQQQPGEPGLASASAAQYRPRILDHASDANTESTNVATNGPSNADNVRDSDMDLIISTDEEVQVEKPSMNGEQMQADSILLNSLLTKSETNNTDGGMTDADLKKEMLASDLVYVKLEEGQVVKSADGGENLIIALNDAQFGGVTGLQQVSQAKQPPATSESEAMNEPEEDKQTISRLMRDLLGKVEMQMQTQTTQNGHNSQNSQKTSSPPRKKSDSTTPERRHAKSDVTTTSQPPQLPLVWRDNIAFLPGTELSFHVNEGGNLVLHCPFIPIKAQMDLAVRKLNLKRSENRKYKHVVVEDKIAKSDEEERRAPQKIRTTTTPKSILKRTTTTAGLTDNSNKITMNSNHNRMLSTQVNRVNQGTVQTYKRRIKNESAPAPAMGSLNSSTNAVQFNSKHGPSSTNEVVRSNPMQKAIKIKTENTYEENKTRYSDPPRRAETATGSRMATAEVNPKNFKSRQSEPAQSLHFNSSAEVLVKSGRTVKPKSTDATTVNTTLCLHCATLGEVANFIEGKYCSEICRRTTRMLAAEELKAKRLGSNGQAHNEGLKGKKKVVEKKTAPPANTVSEEKPHSSPVIYAKKTTIAPIELNGGQKIVPQFLPPMPRLNVHLQEFTQPNSSHCPELQKFEQMEQEEVQLRIEDSESPDQIQDDEEEDDAVKPNPKSGHRVPPRKHRKRASLTMRKRSSGQASRRESRDERRDSSGGSKQVQASTHTHASRNHAVEFNWLNYLKETNAKAAPSRLFKQPVMPLVNPFKVGMCLEAIDPVHPSLFCVVHVVEVLGFRLRLRFTGYAEVYDFWVNADSSDIFPCGWCEEHGQNLLGPPDYEYDKSKPFNWHKYIADVDAVPAGREAFSIVKEEPSDTSSTGLEVGMKLEAVDLKNINYICVATVGNVIGDRFLVHFDSWDSLFDYWTDGTSPFIHPVGWCEQNGRALVPPQWGDARDAKLFVWEEYLRETKSKPMPARLFRTLPPVSFKKGMKLECVDKRTPSLIRVASIAEVDSHFITVHFDGWDSKYDYPVYELSPDIHPVGWCAKTSHPLEPPPPPANSSYWKKKSCPVYGCLGIGNIDGPKFPTHDSELNCPYAEINYMTDFILGDRLGSYNPEPVVPEKPVARRKSGSRRSSTASRTKGVGGARKSTRRSPVRSSDTERKTPQRVSKRMKRESVDEEEEADAEQVPVPRKGQEVVTPTPPPRKKARKSSVDNQEQLGSPPSAGTNEGVNANATTKESTTPASEEQTSSTRRPRRAAATRVPILGKKEKKSVKTVEQTSVGEREKTIQKISTPSSRPGTTASMFAAAHITHKMALGASAATIEPVNELPPNFDAHIQGLQELVSGLNPSIVSKWSVEEVAAFVVKVGCSMTVSQLMVQHKVDGESFLFLKQHDILLLGCPYGPAMKIANALDLINSKS